MKVKQGDLIKLINTEGYDTSRVALGDVFLVCKYNEARGRLNVLKVMHIKNV